KIWKDDFTPSQDKVSALLRMSQGRTVLPRTGAQSQVTQYRLHDVFSFRIGSRKMRYQAHARRGRTRFLMARIRELGKYGSVTRNVTAAQGTTLSHKDTQDYALRKLHSLVERSP